MRTPVRLICSIGLLLMPSIAASQSAAVVPPGSHDSSAITLDAYGFVQVESHLEVLDEADDELSFVPREAELDIVARHELGGLARLDLNFLASNELRTFSTQSQQDLFDALVEQALVEWRRGSVTLRGGKMNTPFGSEPIDAVDRVTLSRSTLARLARPDSLTGVLVDWRPLEEMSAYVTAVNGWDLSVEAAPLGNRSKTIGAGVPHRFGRRGSRWLYSGDLSVLGGAERRGDNDLRILFDYSAELRLVEALALKLELVWGHETGAGLSGQGERDGEHAAVWYGGLAVAEYDVPEQYGWLADAVCAVRLEYVHDQDLTLGLPRRGNLPELTTLFGVAGTMRYELVPGIQATLEYKVDFERGDVAGVSKQRYYPDEPWNIFRWFITQDVFVGLLGSF